MLPLFSCNQHRLVTSLHVTVIASPMELISFPIDKYCECNDLDVQVQIDVTNQDLR